MPGFESLSIGVLLWIVAVMALAGFVQGALGLGFPIVATPLVALTTDMRSAVILVLLPCLATVTANIVKSGSLRAVLAEFWMMPLFMLIGAAIGTQLFIAAPQFPYSLLLAAMMLVYLNLDRFGRTDWPVIRQRKKLFGALPLAVVATITVFHGVRVRNRIDAATYRQWLKRALFVMAMILIVQYAHAKWFA